MILDEYIFLKSSIYHEFRYFFQIFKVTGSIFNDFRKHFSSGRICDPLVIHRFYRRKKCFTTKGSIFISLRFKNLPKYLNSWKIEFLKNMHSSTIKQVTQYMSLTMYTIQHDMYVLHVIMSSVEIYYYINWRRTFFL
jgi:hypothetical protein